MSTVRLSRSDEATLVARVRDGDSAALRTLLDFVSGPILRYGQGFCRHPEDAEDVMQDVLTSLVRSLQSFRGDASLTTWAYIAARRACARNRRRRAHQPAALESLDASGEGGPVAHVTDQAADPLRDLERREFREALEGALAQLAPAYREALILRDIEWLSAEEAADVAGIGVRALKSRLHRARLQVREALAPFASEARAPFASEARAAATPGAGRRRRCPDIARLLSRHLEGEIAAPVCARLERHVRECGNCGAACDSLRRVLGECRAYGTRAIPAMLRDAFTRAARAVVAERS